MTFNKAISRFLATGLLFLASPIAFTHGTHGAFDYQAPSNLYVKIQMQDYFKEMQRVNNLHLDVAGVDIKNNFAEVIVNEAQFHLLRDMGFNATVTMSKFIMAGPDARYKTSAEILQILEETHQKYPNLTQVVEVGKTLRGKPIFAMKISENVEIKDPRKPAVFFNAMHHAREVMGPEVALDILEYLLSHYGSDPEVTKWVANNQIWVLPMFNIDGNDLVWNGSPMWRKNAREDYGVDINRNYPYAWGSCNGSSGTKSAQDYRGESAGSEPETQVMMNLVKTIRPVFSISYHSFSELVLYPQGCNGKRSHMADVIEPLGKAMGDAIDYTAGTPWETLYSVDGGDIDWMNAEYSVIPFVVEVNSSAQGFQPNYSVRQETVERNRPAWQMLLRRLEGPGISGLVSHQGNTVSEFNINVQKQNGFLMSDYMTYKGQSSGAYHLVLNEGTYRMIFSSPNLENKEITVTVDANQRMIQDVEM